MAASIRTSFVQWFRSDGRHFQIVSQLTFLCFGILELGWSSSGFCYLAAFAGALSVQTLSIHYCHTPLHGLKSAIITALGISLLLKANSPFIFLFAALLAIGQKMAFRYNGKHLWNPANFGIVAAIVLSGEAWLSPGQWGSGPLMVFIIGTAGLAVLSSVKRLDTGLIFLVVFASLDWLRVVVYLGWENEVWLHRMSNGSLWLFAFFMITDPMTTPNNRTARIIWAILVAAVSFYLANWYFVYAAPFWTLFFATPLTPCIDKVVSDKSFQWLPSPSSTSSSLQIKN